MTMTDTDTSLLAIEMIERDYCPGPGRHWFDRSSMRFFRSRLAQYGWRGPGGTYFVSSEQPPSGPRRYSVRQLVARGEIVTVGPFCQRSRSWAARTAERLARGEIVPADVD